MKNATARTLLIILAFATGCAPYKYHAAPISPPALARSLQSRSLTDPRLEAWMQNAAHYQPTSWPLRSWNLHDLTLAAWYFNPALDVARQQAAVANAAIETAAMKPNPAASIGSGYETAQAAPFLLTMDLSFPIETAGKRGYRIAGAKHLRQAARIQLAEVAWSVRSQVRIAWISYAFAVRDRDMLQRQVSLESRYSDLLDQQMRAGEIPLPEVTTARIALIQLQQALSAAGGKLATSQASLAAAIGIPDSALSGFEISTQDVDDPPVPGSLPAQSVRDVAVHNRLDVQRSLAEYEAAQSSLQLEVARQYPDIDLGPGYGYEEGYHLATLGLSALLPLRNQNQGPIAEAEARRKLAGARLLSTQSTVIAQTDETLAQYRSAWNALAQARRAAVETAAANRAAQHAFAIGETGRPAAVSAKMQQVVAERAALDALDQTQVALGALENALQRPIGPEAGASFPPQAPRQQEKLP